MMNVLVTGGTGFLGRHVMAELALRGYEADAASRSLSADRWCNLSAESGDAWAHSITDGYDTVIHLAAYCGGIGENMANPVAMFRENMLMGMNILEAAHANGCRVVMVGTICGYPEVPPRIPFVEDDMFAGYPEPTNAPYGVAKRALWTLAKAYHDQDGRGS